MRSLCPNGVINAADDDDDDDDDDENSISRFLSVHIVPGISTIGGIIIIMTVIIIKPFSSIIDSHRVGSGPEIWTRVQLCPALFTKSQNCRGIWGNITVYVNVLMQRYFCRT